MKINPPVTFFFGAMNYLFQATYNNSTTSNSPPVPNKFVLADTANGRVRGTVHISRGKQKYQFFRGIPFAQPPIDELRYEPPEPPERWDGVLDCTNFRSECLNIFLWTPDETPLGDEDCLYINVATRKSFLKDQLSNDGLRPVLVYIYGGMFMIGSSNIYDPVYIMENDVVFVSFNYRVNSFGFLNTGDGVVSGNMGLKDQTLALKWIQENIRFFNGDPKRVVIFGESAGGTSVHLHTMSELSRGLFSGGISMSGTALSPWAMVTNPGAQAREMADAIRCPTNGSEYMIDCMKNLPAAVLIRYHSGYTSDVYKGKRGLFGPTVDTKSLRGYTPFLSAHPQELLETGQVSNVTWMYGVTSAEGIINLIPVFRNENLRNRLNREWRKYAPHMLFYQGHPKESEISQNTRSYYLNNRPLNRETFSEGEKLASDRMFYWDAHQSAMMHSKVAPVYGYYYAYEGLFQLAALTADTENVSYVPPSFHTAFNGWTNWFAVNVFMKKKKHFDGVSHCDDLPIIFNLHYLRREITQKDPDYMFSKKHIKLFVTFAEFGPMPHVMGERVYWPTIRESNPKLKEQPLTMLQLNKTYSIVKEPHYERMQIWKQYDISKFPKLYKNLD